MCLCDPIEFQKTEILQNLKELSGPSKEMRFWFIKALNGSPATVPVCQTISDISNMFKLLISGNELEISRKNIRDINAYWEV